jgi:hypothetical protein
MDMEVGQFHELCFCMYFVFITFSFVRITKWNIFQPAALLFEQSNSRLFEEARIESLLTYLLLPQYMAEGKVNFID